MTVTEETAATSEQDIALELVERCLSDAIRVTRTAFAPARFNSADDYRFQTADDLALFIAGNHPPSDRLVRGLREQLGRLRVAIHWKKNEPYLTDLRNLAVQLKGDAECLKDFPKNGQLLKPEMAKANKAAEALLGALNNLELLRYLFKDDPAILDASLASALTIIFEQSRWARIRKNGRPKNLPDMEIPDWNKFMLELKYIANLAGEAADREKVTKRMTSPSAAESGSKKKHDLHEQSFSPELHCVVIAGVAHLVSTEIANTPREILDVWYSKSKSDRNVMFPPPNVRDEVFFRVWLAAGGDEKRSWLTAGGEKREIYTAESYWRQHCRDALKPACIDLVRLVSLSFR
jgi:hypothetical protein